MLESVVAAACAALEAACTKELTRLSEAEAALDAEDDTIQEAEDVLVGRATCAQAYRRGQRAQLEGTREALRLTLDQHGKGQQPLKDKAAVMRALASARDRAL